MESMYIKSAAKAEQLPEFTEGETAFIGRSNTGKSTLLNALLNRKNLARSGSTPGQTRMVNFFRLGEDRIFADLPGYGYQKGQKNVAAHWQPLVTAYLRRPNIEHIVFLLDIRRKPAEDDIELMYLISRQLPLHLVLTKSDKLNRSEVKKAKDKMEALVAEYDIKVTRIRAISCLKKQGVAELRAEIIRGSAETL